MTRARILADYVAGGTTAAEFDHMDGVTSNVQTQLDNKPSKNMIINGGMQVWQRATAATAAPGYNTADRYYLGESGDGAYTSQKYDMSMADLNTTGHRTALQLNCTTADASVAASHNAYIRYRIEGQDLQQLQYGTASAKTMTLSFWVKSNKTGVYCVNLAASHYLPIDYTISSANTWEKKVITISPTAGGTSLKTSSGGAIANDNGTGMEIMFGLAWGSDFHGTNNTWQSSAKYSTSNQVNWLDSTSNNLYLTGVQLELGSSATPFEHRSYGDELARCQRYYYVIATGGSVSFANTGVYHTNLTYFYVGLPVQMRSAPTYEQVSGSSYYSFYANSTSHSATGFASDLLRHNSIRLNNSDGSLPSIGYPGWWQTANSASFMAVSAEL